MIFYVIAAIFALFVLFAFIRKPLHKVIGIKICAICGAVSLTWIVLLVLKLAGVEISNIILAVLMGESVTGIMYLFERTAKKRGKKRILWLKVFIILFGTLLVYLFLAEGAGRMFIIVLSISVLFLLAIYVNLKRKHESNEIFINKDNKIKGELRKLEEQFEDCCD